MNNGGIFHGLPQVRLRAFLLGLVWYGKGFAVVASEVKSLASQAAANSKELLPAQTLKNFHLSSAQMSPSPKPSAIKNMMA